MTTLTVICLVFAACFGVTVWLLFRALDDLRVHRTVIACLQHQAETQEARLVALEDGVGRWDNQLRWNRRAISALRTDLGPYLPEKARKGAAPPAEAKPKPTPKRRGRRTSFERILEEDDTVGLAEQVMAVLPDPKGDT